MKNYNNLKKFLLICLTISIVCFALPQVAFASWWNPFSWNVWNNISSMFIKKETTNKTNQNIPTIEETSNDTEKIKLTENEPKEKYLPSLTCVPEWKCETWSDCKNSLQTRDCVDANSCGAITDKPTVAQSCVIPCTSNWQCGDWGNCVNSSQTRICTDLNNCGTTSEKPAISQSCTVSDKTTTTIGENYYNKFLSRVRTLLAIHKSFKGWAQDTSDQFRSAVNTLSIYGGGLYGKLRDSTIKFANNEILIISSLVSSNEEWISYYEGMLKNAENYQGEKILDKDSFDSLKDPVDVQADMDSVKNDTNNDLESVLSSITTISD